MHYRANLKDGSKKLRGKAFSIITELGVCGQEISILVKKC